MVLPVTSIKRVTSPFKRLTKHEKIIALNGLRARLFGFYDAHSQFFNTE